MRLEQSSPISDLVNSGLMIIASTTRYFVSETENNAEFVNLLLFGVLWCPKMATQLNTSGCFIQRLKNSRQFTEKKKKIICKSQYIHYV